MGQPEDTSEIDPLYDPVWAIFIYAGWAVLSWVVDDTVGLVSLVASTTGLGLFALRNGGEAKTSAGQSSIRPFAADFSAVLLFCAASIGASVLFLRVVEQAPELLLSGLFFSAAAAIVIDLGRREMPSA